MVWSRSQSPDKKYGLDFDLVAKMSVSAGLQAQEISMLVGVVSSRSQFGLNASISACTSVSMTKLRSSAGLNRGLDSREFRFCVEGSASLNATAALPGVVSCLGLSARSVVVS